MNQSRINFYKSKAWEDVRKTVWLKQNLLCNRCHRPVYVDGLSTYIPKERRLKGIVHHKEYLDDTNIYDINLTLNMDNLEGLCIDCHNNEHFKGGVTRQEYKFDEMGNLIKRGNDRGA